MQLLDTIVVSELRKLKSGRADPAVSRWASSAVASGFFMSVITLMELESGVLLVSRRDPAQGRQLRVWLNALRVPARA
jgi:toxin FitB